MSDKGLNGQKQYLKDFLTNKLTRTERLIVVLYYYDEMTMVEIANVLEVSPSEVSQMHSSIISRCKSYLREQGFS
jgi:RNA polymerase sigma factor for flagellar operon FliA